MFNDEKGENQGCVSAFVIVLLVMLLGWMVYSSHKKILYSFYNIWAAA
jgi:hypothetical protein